MNTLPLCVPLWVEKLKDVTFCLAEIIVNFKILCYNRNKIKASEVNI